jgi:hypothetical protein
MIAARASRSYCSTRIVHRGDSPLSATIIGKIAGCMEKVLIKKRYIGLLSR